MNSIEDFDADKNEKESRRIKCYFNKIENSEFNLNFKNISDKSLFLKFYLNDKINKCLSCTPSKINLESLNIVNIKINLFKNITDFKGRIRLILVPYKNLEEFEEIKTDIKNNFQVFIYKKIHFSFNQSLKLILEEKKFEVNKNTLIILNENGIQEVVEDFDVNDRFDTEAE